MAVGKKFSIDFQQATEISGNTQIMVQPEGQPVEKASVEQLGMALVKGNVVPGTTGTYPQMSVGFAENVVGDGSATAEVFSFRPTAGVNRNTLNDGAARIHTLKGSSVVVNQIAKPRVSGSSNGVTWAIAEDGTITLNGTATDQVIFNPFTAPQIIGHKYLMIGTPNGGGANKYYMNNQASAYDYGAGVIYNSTVDSTNWWFTFVIQPSVSVNFTFKPRLIDLTLMFRAGNEPTTVAEFYQRMPLGADLDVYNEGTIVDGHYGAIKTTGFNQWDEQWERGAFDYYTGAKITDNSRIRSKNFIPVFPGTQYYYKMPNSWQVCYWDAEKQFISASQNSTDVAENTPQNCHYITFNVGYSGAPITEYNNDICISLYWPTEYGNLYGTYKPYKPFERDLSWVAKYFPNGMRSAGNVADEIRFNSTEQRWEAVQRVGVVDLGSLEWSAMSSVSSGVKIMRTFFDLKALATNVIGNITSEKYTPSTADDVYLLTSDKTIAAAYHATGNYIAVYDSEYPTAEDVPSFEVAMQGVLLNYELAEPIVTPITENINFDYDVSDYGTEELIVAEGVESAPLSASIEYSPNVLAILKNAPGIANDVDMLKSQLSALTAQLAALTATNNE